VAVSRANGLSVPSRKTSHHKILVECQYTSKSLGLHYRKAYCVRICNRLIAKPAEPCSGAFMMLGAGKHDFEFLCSTQMIEGGGGRFDAGTVQKQPVDLGKHEVCCDQAPSLLQSRTNEPICFVMMLIARAEESDPSAAIDEQCAGGGGPSRQRKCP
jgi:hypothetical protein